MSYIQEHPAYLFIGNLLTIEQEAKSVLKDVLCSMPNDKDKSYCNVCVNCIAVDMNQHYSVRWIKPEKNYTVQDLEIIFSTAIYKLPDNTHFYFILDNAQKLSAACSNRLLKMLEEPLPGYHFILLSSSKEALLPTVVSRCVIKKFNTESAQDDELVNFFIHPSVDRLESFKEYLDKNKPDEYMVVSVLDALESFWLKHCQDYDSEDIKNKLEFIKKIRKYSPMQANAKLALKSIMLFLLGLN